MKKISFILACLLCSLTLVSCADTDDGDSSSEYIQSTSSEYVETGSSDTAPSSDAEDVSEERSEASETSEESQPVVQPAEKVYVENIDDFTVVAMDNGEYCITKYNGSDPYVVVPATYQGQLISKVASETFDYCKFIRGIKVSEGIVEFGFINEASDLEIKCTDIEEISLPTTLKFCGGFTWCDKLKEIVLPERVTSLTLGAFFMCTSLERAIMPGIDSLPLDCFGGCEKLKYLTTKPLMYLGRNSLDSTAIEALYLPDNFEMLAPGGFPKHCKVYISKKLFENEQAMSSIVSELSSGVTLYVELEEGSDMYVVYAPNHY